MPKMDAISLDGGGFVMNGGERFQPVPIMACEAWILSVDNITSSPSSTWEHLHFVMLKIGKLAQQAIAAASYLAERYDEAATRISAREIADARELPRPVVAKVLAQLSLHGITSGSTGPSGGYRLAKSPDEISLHEIVAVFERPDVRPMCPFGPKWCGSGPPCPLHDSIARVSHDVERFLQSQNLGPFHGLQSPAGPEALNKRRV